MLPWLLFSETVQRSSTSLLEQANLITKTVFPAEVVPVSLFLSSLVSHVMALALAIVAVAVVLGNLSPGLVLLPIYIAILGLFAVGVGWIVASLQVYLRDTAQVLSVALTFWFWLTPVFIPEQRYAKYRLPGGSQSAGVPGPRLSRNSAVQSRAHRSTIWRWSLFMPSPHSVRAACFSGI